MTDYKKGDRVHVRQDAADHGRVDNTKFLGRYGKIENVADISLGGYRFKVVTEDGLVEDFRSTQLDPVARDLDHLRVGDILLDDCDNEREVYAVLGKIVAVHDGCNYGHYDPEWLHTDSLKHRGWTLKDSPTESVELTLEDVAKLKGVPVDQIKIVEK